jgi:hypothetical protein
LYAGLLCFALGRPTFFCSTAPTLVENTTELAVVKLVRERREDGWSLEMIATALNEDKVPTKLRKRWHARTVKNVIDNDIYDQRA